MTSAVVGDLEELKVIGYTSRHILETIQVGEWGVLLMRMDTSLTLWVTCW